MAIILPTAPSNFYAPSLQTLKDALEATNGNTAGTASLITALPANINSAWAEVGAGNYTIDDPANFGTYVVGSGPIGTISEIIAGTEEAVGESGYKLDFGAIPECYIYIDGSGFTTATVIGVSLQVGRDLFASGGNDDVKYILPVSNLVVTDGQFASFKPFSIEIGYAQTAP